MSDPNENSESQLADRLKLVRQIEAKLQNSQNPQVTLTRWQYVLIFLVGGVIFVLWSWWTATWPIPRGKQNREKSAAFLEQQFPNRGLSPSAEDNATAPVAAVFHVIRHEKPNDATKAINFAAEQEFGYASPYVIERLESDDRDLRRAARQFLTKMAGKDYGPNAEAWKAWWHDPPRRLAGIATLGHHSFQMAIPVGSALIGGLLFFIGFRMKGDVVSTLGSALMGLGWFLLIVTLGIQYVGSFETCTFGGTEITYHQGHGVVEGLADAYSGGIGLWLTLCAAFVGIPFALAIVIMLIGQWCSKNGRTPSSSTETKQQEERRPR